MANASISGLASGLDTASIVNQLMQLEAVGQSRLKSRLSTEKSALTIFQGLNTKLLALNTAAKDLTKATTWQAYAATSSSDKVTATTTATASPSSVSFTVGAVAKAHSHSFNTTAALTDVVTTGSTQVRLDFLDGNTLDVETTDGTLSGLVSAINGANAGVHASTVKLDDGTYRLSVTSTTTGAASDFTLKNLDGSDILGGTAVTAGQDAAITVGVDTLHSATNTFAGVLPGVDVTLAASATIGENVTVTVAQDTTALGDKIKAMVDSVNELLTEIDKYSAYDATTKKQGILGTDSGLRTVRSALVNTVFPGGTASMSAYGVQLDKYGKLTFDEDKFDASYAADPVATKAAFASDAATGFAHRVAAAADGASDATNGTITLAITGRNSGIKRLEDQIDSWDVRLSLRRQALERQFTALETALGQMQSQSSWLSSQIASLPTAG
jgi:flagellar hook-associated protein 2